jgi:hypothetical protein
MTMKLCVGAIAGILCLAAPGTAAAGWFKDSPLEGYWPLNEGRGQVAYDWSGNGNHGQLGSTPGVDSNDPTWMRGRWSWFGFGGYMNFGGDDFITIEDDASLEPARITVEAWFRRSGSPGKHLYLVSKGGTACENGSYGLYTSESGGMAFYVADGSPWTRSPEADQSIWDGRWHHAAGTFDGTTVRLFIDGREIGSGTPSGGDILYDLPMQESYLGAYRGTCDFIFEGDVDGVRIWSKALPVGTIWSKARELLASLR